MKNKLKLIWGTDNKDYSAKFIPCGVAMNKVQFAYRNVVGEGRDTKFRAVLSWIRQVIQYL